VAALTIVEACLTSLLRTFAGRMRSVKTLFILLLVSGFFLLGAPEVQAQCAMCKEAAEKSMKHDPKSIARGLNSGILYLMAVPYLAIMFIFRKQLLQLWRKFVRRPGREAM
jgi:hypothetical protein